MIKKELFFAILMTYTSSLSGQIKSITAFDPDENIVTIIDTFFAKKLAVVTFFRENSEATASFILTRDNQVAVEKFLDTHYSTTNINTVIEQIVGKYGGVYSVSCVMLRMMARSLREKWTNIDCNAELTVVSKHKNYTIHNVRDANVILYYVRRSLLYKVAHRQHFHPSEVNSYNYIVIAVPMQVE